jgi:hypothetical protein
MAKKWYHCKSPGSEVPPVVLPLRLPAVRWVMDSRAPLRRGGSDPQTCLPTDPAPMPRRTLTRSAIPSKNKALVCQSNLTLKAPLLSTLRTR